MKLFRILGRSIRDAFKSVFRNVSLSIASISCLTITLLIVSISFVLSHNLEYVAVLKKAEDMDTFCPDVCTFVSLCLYGCHHQIHRRKP